MNGWVIIKNEAGKFQTYWNENKKRWDMLKSYATRYCTEYFAKGVVAEESLVESNPSASVIVRKVKVNKKIFNGFLK